MPKLRAEGNAPSRSALFPDSNKTLILAPHQPQARISVKRQSRFQLLKTGAVLSAVHNRIQIHVEFLYDKQRLITPEEQRLVVSVLR